MKFNEFYFQQNINEGFFSSLFDLTKIGIGGLFNLIKPKSKKINNLKPNFNVEISKVLLSYLHKLLASDLLLWRKTSKNKGMIGKFIEKHKNIYVTQLESGQLNKTLYDDFGRLFNLSEKFLINEYSVYTISNGGELSLISVADPYIGKEFQGHQTPLKMVSKLETVLKNLKYFIYIDEKAQKWFSEKTGMLFKQYIVTRQNVTDKDLQQDLERMSKTFDDIFQDELVDKDKNKDKDTMVVNNNIIITKNKMGIEETAYKNLKTNSSKFFTMKYNTKSIINDDKLEIIKYSIDDGKYRNAEISILHDKKPDKYYLLPDDIGLRMLNDLNIVRT